MKLNRWFFCALVVIDGGAIFLFWVCLYLLHLNLKTPDFLVPDEIIFALVGEVMAGISMFFITLFLINSIRASLKEPFTFTKGE
ncbi:MAG: hypothetical protein U9P50_00285 [Patescibacteria group bacterium]|nr:hypothetical protein [Patescibacteria group bacterium]